MKFLKVSVEPFHRADLNLMTQIRRRFSGDLNVKLTKLEVASRGGREQRVIRTERGKCLSLG